MMQKRADIRKMTHVALCAVLIAVCSWITIPAAVPFTLQTFAVFTACALLGGKSGLCAVGLYMLLGAVGLPVFSGFGAGMGALLGPTGGYILGFAFTALSMWGVEARFGQGLPRASRAWRWACCSATPLARHGSCLSMRARAAHRPGRGAFHVRGALPAAGLRQDRFGAVRFRAAQAPACQK